MYKRQVFILDVKTNKFITVNKAATTVYGYSHEEFLDLSLKDLTLDDEEFDPGKTEGVGMVRRDIAIAVSKHQAQRWQRILCRIIDAGY